MPTVDLHIHTTATPHHSSWDPQVLAAAAAQRGLAAIAAVDHNTTGGVLALQAAGLQHGLRVVAGVEFDSAFGGKLWHTLVYGVPADAPDLLALCDAVYVSNMADAGSLFQALPRYGLILNGLDTLGRPPNVADVATALARQNDLPDRIPGEDDENAGMRYLLTQVPHGYTPLNVADIIAVAHRLGGLAVLAHPGRSKGIYAVPATAEDIAALVAVGLDGLEVYYPSHSPAQTTFYHEQAQLHGLLITGGSDSHHPSQPLASWDSELCQAFLDRVS